MYNKNLVITGVLFSIVFTISCTSESLKKLEKPNALSVGDTIAFCAPSGFLDSTRMNLARSRLQEKGFTVVQSDSLFKNWGYLAGTDEQRANELMSYFRNKSVKAIFPGAGLSLIHI